MRDLKSRQRSRAIAVSASGRCSAARARAACPWAVRPSRSSAREGTRSREKPVALGPSAEDPSDKARRGTGGSSVHPRHERSTTEGAPQPSRTSCGNGRNARTRGSVSCCLCCRGTLSDAWMLWREPKRVAHPAFRDTVASHPPPHVSDVARYAASRKRMRRVVAAIARVRRRNCIGGTRLHYRSRRSDER